MTNHSGIAGNFIVSLDVLSTELWIYDKSA